MVHVSLDSAKSLFERLINSQGFAPQKVLPPKVSRINKKGRSRHLWFHKNNLLSYKYQNEVAAGAIELKP